MTRPARDEMSSQSVGRTPDCISSLHLYALGLALSAPCMCRHGAKHTQQNYKITG